MTPRESLGARLRKTIIRPAPERATPTRVPSSSLRSNSASLDALAAGTPVRDRSGAVFGTVSRVVRSESGRVRAVLVRLRDRGTVNLAPGGLRLAGGVLTANESAMALH